MPGCHWRFIRTCYAIRGFALANMGIDTRLIQDYLGHRNIRHTVWYTASNAGRFYGIWDRARGRQRHAVL